MEDFLADLGPKLGTMIFFLAAFLAVVAAVLLLAERSPKSVRERVQIGVFAGPALLLLGIFLVYPALRTLWLSLLDRQGEAFVGLENYVWVFQDPNSFTTIRNTLIWVVLTPLLSTGIGLIYAILIDRSRFESVAKSLLFMPVSISFVGAGIIWKFVYAQRPAELDQIGLANQLRIWFGAEPMNFLNNAPANTLFLILVMIWIQAGFAMVLLSAAIKAIPTDIVEAARLDGVNAWQMFRSVTIPSIRPTLVVVLTTITIGVLKVFDIVRTMTGGQFDTSVVANAMYDQSFVFGESGRGGALAVLIFVLVIPIVIYNIRQLNEARSVR
jgi:alpha-glucoside transport system permease protein